MSASLTEPRVGTVVTGPSGSMSSTCRAGSARSEPVACCRSRAHVAPREPEGPVGAGTLDPPPLEGGLANSPTSTIQEANP